MPATLKRLSVVCPYCFDPDSTVTLDLNNLDRCECSSCGTEFTPARAAAAFNEAARRWAKVAEWIEAAGQFTAAD